MTDQIAELPDWLRELVVRPTVAPRVTVDDAEMDTPFAIDEAEREIKRWLVNHGQPEIGEASDDRTYKLACRLKDMAISQDRILEMLSDLWAPHFDRDWIVEKVSSAFRNGQNDPASDRPRPDEEVFAGVDISESQASGQGLKLQRGADVRASEVQWLWPGHLALGKYTAFAGDPGTGKSTIAFDWAATVTTGGNWPDGSHCPAGDVLIWSGEDDFADTILPRFLASQGDANRLYRPQHIEEWGGQKRWFDPARDAGALLASISDMPELRLLVIDPIVSAIAGDGHRNNEVRRGLEPLIRLAEDRGICFVGITHFTKGTSGKPVLERVTGSLAYGAAARVVLAAGKMGEDEPRRLVRVKSNIGVDGGGFEYLLRQDIVPGYGFQAQCVSWGKKMTGSALDLLGGDDQEKSSLLGAAAWLEELIRSNGGAMETRDIKAGADANGHSWRTIRRAKDLLGNITARQNLGSAHAGWLWMMPKDDPSPF